jgi:hypothetical protein
MSVGSNSAYVSGSASVDSFSIFPFKKVAEVIKMRSRIMEKLRFG